MRSVFTFMPQSLLWVFDPICTATLEVHERKKVQCSSEVVIDICAGIGRRKSGSITGHSSFFFSVSVSLTLFVLLSINIKQSIRLLDQSQCKNMLSC